MTNDYDCQCPADGFCQRYRRTMAGRLREICRGENIAPEKAAVYRRHWAHAGQASPPNLLQQGLGLITASTRWRAAGMPMRTAEEVTTAFNACLGCEQFRPGKADGEGSCAQCGCRLTNQVEKWNKIALATENCPQGKWELEAVATEQRQPSPCCELTHAALTPQTPIEDVMALLQRAPGDWPADWAAWRNVIEAHTEILIEAASRHRPYPGGYSGRGIVSCVSAKPGYSSGKDLAHGYFPGAWCMVKELRRLGCTLPITFANLGPLEWDPTLTALMAPLGVEVIDLARWNPQQAEPMRILNGWESKIAAILAAPYEEILFLDADNIPIRDPSFLFDDPQYRELGAAFWPDFPPHDRPEWLPEVVWNNCGMEYRDEVDFESGQLMVNKATCWSELQLAKHINEHSDYWYKQVFGDKSTFHLAWARLNRPYAMTPIAAGWNGGAILQHDLQGRLLFEHGAQNKPTLYDFPKGQSCLSNPGECHQHLAELRSLWNGRLWSIPSPQDLELTRDLVGKRFTYRRVGLDERPIRLLEDSRIGLGMARCEAGWSIVGGVLCVSDVDGRPTFFANQQPDGRWRGRWEQHERCQVELIPDAV